MVPIVLTIVDDDPAFRGVVRAVAENLYFDVIEANSGAHYLENPAARDADILVLDVVMPEMHGLELLDFVAGRGRSRLILVTGYGPNFLDSAVKMAAEKGIDVVGGLCKPIHIDDLESILKKAAGSRTGAPG